MAVYGGTLWLTRAISADEIMSLFQKGDNRALTNAEPIETNIIT